MHELTLKDRLGIVTGATAGIGEAITRDLITHGARLVINGRRAERLAELVHEFGTKDVAPVVGDCVDDAVIDLMFNAAREHFGENNRSVDLVVINAGRGLSGSVVTSDPTQWEEMIRTNLLGAAKLLRAAANAMLVDIGTKAGPAALDKPRDIVVLGSTVGRHISPFSSMYGATKFAVNSLAEAARRELGPKGIRVTLIEPGFVVSEFQGVAGYKAEWFEEVKGRIGPVLTPEDVARTITFIVQQPAAVHISDVLIRPTRQDYP
jgi:NADP-dependent 3-hydroxy acid dehydrogenase YdfG